MILIHILLLIFLIEDIYYLNYLESSLQEYMEDRALHETIFDISKIPAITKTQEMSEQLHY